MMRGGRRPEDLPPGQTKNALRNASCHAIAATPTDSLLQATSTPCPTMSASPTRKRPRTESEEQVVKQERQAAPAAPGASADAQLEVQLQARVEPNLDSEREDDGSPAPRRDADFWFSDGTIILAARDVEFRVYGGLLGEHSSVFRAMFAEQHPIRLIPFNEHLPIPCPVVQLADAPEDLCHILRIYVSRRPAR